LVKSLEEESKAIKKELLKMCWYMRGSITIEQAYQLDTESREIIAQIIEENLQVTKDSGLPFF
jgi:hypothetical protein